MLKNQPSTSLKVVFFLTLLLILVATVYVLTSKKEPSKNTPSSNHVTVSGRERVFVSGLPESIDKETKKSIERTLYESVDKEKLNLFTGVVREKSFSSKALPSGQTMSNLLIDVEPSKVTYLVTLYTSPRGRPSVTIDCAPQDKQITSSAICKDTHHHE